MWLRKKVRELNTRYEERLEFLQKEYKEELLILQAKCDHSHSSNWSYEVDTYGEVASTADGILIKYRECYICGLVEKKVDDTNDYESEIEF
jgi:hypothetical protein